MARSVNDRIDWFRSNRPSAVGMCLRHTWLATDIPPAGCDDANEGVALVRAAHKMHTDRQAPRGAWVWYTSSTHGHVALSLGDGRILSTDVNGPATTGTVSLSYIETAWGHRFAGWSSWYGVEFPVRLGAKQRHLLERLSDRISGFTKRIKELRRAREQARAQRRRARDN